MFDLNKILGRSIPSKGGTRKRTKMGTQNENGEGPNKRVSKNYELFLSN